MFDCTINKSHIFSGEVDMRSNKEICGTEGNTNRQNPYKIPRRQWYSQSLPAGIAGEGNAAIAYAGLGRRAEPVAKQ